MKKVFTVLKSIFVLSIVFILLVSESVFCYHRYQLSKESELIKSEGTLVDFNNKKINVYNEGDGADTYVFMPGLGIAAPVYEMKGLYSKFSKEKDCCC